MEVLGVVQASPTLAQKHAPADEAYATEFFRLKREFTRTAHDDWLVLSATHGLLEPDERVASDEVTFEEMQPAAQARWALDVVAELATVVRRNEYDEVAVLASRSVRNTLTERGGLRDRILAAGATVSEPLAGLGGEEHQQAWLVEQLEIRNGGRP